MLPPVRGAQPGVNTDHGPSGGEWGSGDQGDGGLRFKAKTRVWRSI